MKLLARRVYRFVLDVVRNFSIKLLSKNVRLLKPYISLKFDSRSTKDGFGAQVHRIFSLCVLSDFFEFQMLRPEIVNLTWHPMDPFTNLGDLNNFIDNCNSALFTSDHFVDTHIESKEREFITIESIRLRHVAWFSLVSTFKKREICLVSQEAHSITDLLVDRFPICFERYFSEFSRVYLRSKTSKDLIVHYRQGVGGFVVHPGQKIPRQLQIDHFTSKIENALNELPSGDIARIRVFTDAPTSDLYFTPPEEQLSLWVGQPGYHDGIVLCKGLDIAPFFEKVAQKHNLPVSIEAHLDGLNMLTEMALAKMLITSRSSLSYIAGVFNKQGIVYGSPDFWHKKPPSWRI